MSDNKRPRYGGRYLPPLRPLDELPAVELTPHVDHVDDHREWEAGHDFADEFGTTTAFGEAIE